jgi:hypothetical protein
MNIRAKFKVISVIPHSEGNAEPEHTSINLMAVYSDDPNHENAKYWKYTPSGNLMMTVLSHVVSDFEVGQEYYITLELAESAPHD